MGTSISSINFLFCVVLKECLFVEDSVTAAQVNKLSYPEREKNNENYHNKNVRFRKCRYNRSSANANKYM